MQRRLKPHPHRNSAIHTFANSDLMRAVRVREIQLIGQVLDIELYAEVVAWLVSCSEIKPCIFRQY